MNIKKYLLKNSSRILYGSNDLLKKSLISYKSSKFTTTTFSRIEKTENKNENVQGNNFKGNFNFRNNMKDNTNSNNNFNNMKEKPKTFRPVSKINEMSFPMYYKRAIMNLDFPVNEDYLIQILFAISSEYDFNVVLKEVGYYVPMKLILITLASKNKAIIVVENDSHAEEILKISEEVDYGVVYVKDKSDLNVIQNGLAKVLILNSSLFLEQMNSPLYKEKIQTIFFEIKPGKNYENFSKNFNQAFPNSKVMTINKNPQDMKSLNQYQGRYNSLNNFEEAILKKLAVEHFAMCVTQENNMLVTVECVNKYQSLDKKILVIFPNEKEKSSFPLKETNKLTLLTESELEDQHVSLKEKFNVLIEYYYINGSELMKRKELLEVSDWNRPVMISLFENQQFSEISSFRQSDQCRLKISNLLSNSFLINSFNNKNNNNKSEIEKQFISKFEQIANPLDYDKNEIATYEKLYEIVKLNDSYNKFICYHFFKNHCNQLFNEEKEKVSLITGKPGYYTVHFIPESTKQLEDRYFIVKFIIDQKIATSEHLDKRFFREYESFNYIGDIPCNRFDEICKNAALKKIRIEILKEMPIVFFNQFYDMLNELKPK